MVGFGKSVNFQEDVPLRPCHLHRIPNLGQELDTQLHLTLFGFTAKTGFQQSAPTAEPSFHVQPLNRGHCMYAGQIQTGAHLHSRAISDRKQSVRHSTRASGHRYQRSLISYHFRILLLGTRTLWTTPTRKVWSQEL